LIPNDIRQWNRVAICQAQHNAKHLFGEDPHIYFILFKKIKTRFPAYSLPAASRHSRQFQPAGAGHPGGLGHEPRTDRTASAPHHPAAAEEALPGSSARLGGPER